MKKILLGFILGIITSVSIGATAIILYRANDISFAPIDSNWNVFNIEDAINDLYVKKQEKESLLNHVWEFDFIKGEERFVIPQTGTYKLEVWGAQGGYSYTTNYKHNGGYGAYATGEIVLEEGKILYINVGGKGDSYKNTTLIEEGNGYNGGGRAVFQPEIYMAGGGGGATHIALYSGLLSNLSEHKEDDSILIVAGGGGGSTSNTTTVASHHSDGGHAGGIKGSVGKPVASESLSADAGGGQTAGGSTTVSGGTYPESYAGFGKGCNPKSSYSTHLKIAGGSGWYGGGCVTHSGGGGGGGSSWIANTNLNNGIMYCYDCIESSGTTTKTISSTCVNNTPTEKCAKSENGYAKITLISVY